MLSFGAALLALAGMGSIGAALLRKLDCGLTSLEELAYGIPLGIVVSSLAILILAAPLGLSGALVAAVALASALAALALRSGGSRQAFQGLRSEFSGFAIIVLGVLAVRWALLSHGALTMEADGLWAGHRNIWGDWAQHLGDVTSFAYGDNFPPTHPRIAGAAFAYHYLTSVTVAAMVACGMSPMAALPLHSFLLCVCVAIGVYAFAKRLAGGAASAALTVILFFVGGGLGWILTMGDAIHAPSFWGELIRQPWDAAAQQTANYRWLNVFFSLVYPQRGFLYGLPLGLLVLTLLLRAASDENRTRVFLIAGLVAGLLPLAHLGTLLSLALITPFMFLLFPSRGWVVYYVVWIAVAVPQLWIQQGGGPGAAGAIRFHPGWVDGTDAWWWFWLKNLGAFIPLLGNALLDRKLLSPQATRMLWAIMPVFVITNLVAFQPWDWDNSKFLAYWFLAVCILVSAVLVKMWSEFPSVPVRAFLVATVLTMTLSGLLENLSQLLGRDRHLMLTREEVGLADEVRRLTKPHAIFAAGLQHNHPVPVLAGRRVLMSYPGWMWTQGADTRKREQDLRRIFALSPEAKALLTEYGVDYVVIGPNEKDAMRADPDAYRRTYRTILKTDNYEVFDVKATASATTSSPSTTPGVRSAVP